MIIMQSISEWDIRSDERITISFIPLAASQRSPWGHCDLHFIPVGDSESPILRIYDSPSRA